MSFGGPKSWVPPAFRTNDLTKKGGSYEKENEYHDGFL
jgi:hypothetical protein